MMAWYQSRDQREQILLAILALLIGFWIIWVGLLSPLNTSKAEAERSLIKAQNDHRTLMRAAPYLGAGQNMAEDRKNFDRNSLISLAREKDIRLTRVQPESEGQISVWVDDVQTQELYDLLEDLLTGFDVEMIRASISAATEGRVSGQFTLASN